MSGLIDSQKVHDIAMACLCQEDEVSEDKKSINSDVKWIEAEGVTATFVFVKKRLDIYVDDINMMLDNLPETFHADSGGGWSFLNACNDRDGNRWTGEHQIMELLFCLGIAIGRVKFPLPKSLWVSLPGGMPYLAIRKKGNEVAVPVRTGQPVKEGSL